jgi:hypothetical protein
MMKSCITTTFNFEDGWLIKSSFITKDEHKACQLTRTKKQKKYNKVSKKDWLDLNFQMINTSRQTLFEYTTGLQGWKQYFIKWIVMS